MATKAKKVLRPRTVRQTRRWLRETFAQYAQLDSVPELPEGWFPDVPADPSCSGSDGDQEEDQAQGGLPGGGEPTPGAGAEQAEEDTGEYAPGDVPGTGDVGDEEDSEAEAGAEGGDEGDGGDEQGEAQGAGDAPAPEPVQLRPRGTTFRPADQEDHGTIFSHVTKRSERGGNIYRREFSSVQDFMSQPFANPDNLQVFRQDMLDSDTGTWRSWRKRALRGFIRKTDMEWYGAESGELAADYAVHGWPEGAERVRTLLADIEAPQPVSVKRKLRRGDQGDELDIHAVYRGALDRAWTRRQRTHHRARMTVRLVVQLGGSQLMVQEELFWRGAAVAKLNELLEEAGYGVELMCIETTNVEGHKHQSHQLFCLKDAGTPLNLEQVAGVVCSAGFYRTWGFRGVYAISEHKLTYSPTETVLGNSYTHHVDPLTDELYLLGSDGTPTFVVPIDVDDAKSAREFINETLAALAAGVQEAA